MIGLIESMFIVIHIIVMQMLVQIIVKLYQLIMIVNLHQIKRIVIYLKDMLKVKVVIFDIIGEYYCVYT